MNTLSRQVRHFIPDAIFSGVSCNPCRLTDPRQTKGNPRRRITVRAVDKALWKRSLGLDVKKIGIYVGRGEQFVRSLFHKLQIPIDIPRSRQEVRSSAVADYVSGMRLKDIAKKYGFGSSSILRWVNAAGVSETASARKALHVSVRPAGKERIGKKGLYHTSKGDRWVATDSVYEYARIDQHENDPMVVDIQRCTERVEYVFDGSVRTYIPDLRVEYADGSVCVEEVKPDKWRNEAKVLAKEAAAIAFFGYRGIRYAVVTENEIGRELIAACSADVHSRLDPSYAEEMKARRREQKRLAASRYYRKKTGKLAS